MFSCIYFHKPDTFIGTHLMLVEPDSVFDRYVAFFNTLLNNEVSKFSYRLHN